MKWSTFPLISQLLSYPKWSVVPPETTIGQRFASNLNWPQSVRQLLQCPLRKTGWRQDQGQNESGRALSNYRHELAGIHYLDAMWIFPGNHVCRNITVREIRCDVRFHATNAYGTQAASHRAQGFLRSDFLVAPCLMHPAVRNRRNH